MTEDSLATQSVDMSDVPIQLPSLVESISKRKTRLRIDDHGVPIAAVVSIPDLLRLEQWDREKAAGRKALEEFGAAFADVPLEELEAQVTRIIAEIRQADIEAPERKLA